MTSYSVIIFFVKYSFCIYKFKLEWFNNLKQYSIKQMQNRIIFERALSSA